MMRSVNGIYGYILVALIIAFLFNCERASSRSLRLRRMCTYGNMTVLAGRRFHPEPCMTCSCSRHGGKVTCSIKDCQRDLNCLVFDKHSNFCCPKCLEYGCAHTDGKVYPKGSPIVNTDCISCYCPQEGGETVCDVTPCEAVACDNPRKKEGECCPYCENETYYAKSRFRSFG